MLFPTKEGEVWQVLVSHEIEQFRDQLEPMAQRFCDMAPWMGVKDGTHLVEFMKWAASQAGYAVWLVGEIDSDKLFGFCTMSLDDKLVGPGRMVSVHTCYMDKDHPHDEIMNMLVSIAEGWGKQHGADAIHMASSPQAGEQWAKRRGFKVESINYKREF